MRVPCGKADKGHRQSCQSEDMLTVGIGLQDASRTVNRSNLSESIPQVCSRSCLRHPWSTSLTAGKNCSSCGCLFHPAQGSSLRPWTHRSQFAMVGRMITITLVRALTKIDPLNEWSVVLRPSAHRLQHKGLV